MLSSPRWAYVSLEIRINVINTTPGQKTTKKKSVTTRNRNSEKWKWKRGNVSTSIGIQIGRRWRQQLNLVGSGLAECVKFQLFF